jgi:hypothetical protein
MKALWFMPLAFAGGAEGFALFAPYLIGVLTVLYVARTLRAARLARVAEIPPQRSLMPVAIAAAVQPAL